MREVRTTMLSKTMREVPILGLSNFDHTAKPGTEELLRINPNEVWVPYTAWNFFAYVYFDGYGFVAEVMQNGEHVNTIKVERFYDIIPTVSELYGWE